MQEEVDRLASRHAVLLGESHRIDAHELAVVRVFEQGEEPLVHG